MVFIRCLCYTLSKNTNAKENRDMTTEERLTALETDRTTLTRIASEQMLRLRDIEHNEAILLGVQGSQGQDIKEMKTDIKEMKADIATVKDHLERMESHFDERLDAIMAMLNRMQSPPSQ